jgi:aminopeptidase-like protein
MPIGQDLYSHVEALFPICRSITGDGLRYTLKYIAGRIPLAIREVVTGTAVLDWTIPNEWIVRGASICRLTGETIVDFAYHNLHLVQYSVPVDRVVTREELDAHLYSLPEQPDLIPYRTAYYADTWGFCLRHIDRLALTDRQYRVQVDTELRPGSLSFGECWLPGETPAEMLISVHCCHPSLANDNLSAIAVAIELARWLAGQPRRLSYRLLFIPGTIGAITWLHFNRDAAQRVRHGLVLSCLGDSGPPTYKQSRQGHAPIDRYVGAVLRQIGHGDRVLPFTPYGYDERQYCSPGFDLPVGCLMRSPNGTFPEYHTSADNLAFVRPAALAGSLELIQRIIAVIEEDGFWRNMHPYGEPQLGRRGLYAKIGGQAASDRGTGEGFDQLTLLWVLNQSDGRHSLLDISERSGKPFQAVVAAARVLHEAGLLDPVPDADRFDGSRQDS